MRVVGADGQQLIDPFIEALGGSSGADTWQEQVGGKTVTRWSPDGVDLDGEDANYAYAFEDVAILFHARRPQEAEEALRAMP